MEKAAENVKHMKIEGKVFKLKKQKGRKFKPVCTFCAKAGHIKKFCVKKNLECYNCG